MYLEYLSYIALMREQYLSLYTIYLEQLLAYTVSWILQNISSHLDKVKHSVLNHSKSLHSSDFTLYALYLERK